MKTSCPSSRSSRLRCSAAPLAHGYRLQRYTGETRHPDVEPVVVHEVRGGRVHRTRLYGAGFLACPYSLPRPELGQYGTRYCTAEGGSWWTPSQPPCRQVASEEHTVSYPCLPSKEGCCSEVLPTLAYTTRRPCYPPR